MGVRVSDPAQLHALTVTGQGGEKLGKFDEIFFDRSTHRPEWAAVRTGLFGSHVSLAPLANADLAGDELRAPCRPPMKKYGSSANRSPDPNQGDAMNGVDL